MAASSDERALAAVLAGMTDPELAEVFSLRDVPPDVAWRDLFDAAEQLLAPASVDRALNELSRGPLIALREGRPEPALRARALLRPDGSPYAIVSARLAEVRAVVDAVGDDDVLAPAVPVPPDAVAAAAEHAFDAVGSLTDVLLWTLASPLARTGAGPVAVTDRRRLVDQGAVADVDALEDLLAVAAGAGLVRDVNRSWQATASAERWIGTSTPLRWAALAEGFVRSLRPGIRHGAGHLPVSAWASAYPLDPEWPAAAALLRRRARRIGLIADGDAEPPWSRGLRERGVADLEPLVELLPAEIDRVYLQADLTAIAPGPLQPALEQRLRRMAVRETRAQASTYRFGPESLASAVATGETAESLRGFLGALSLTGIPQPLAYLIDRATADRARLRVGTDPETGRTTIAADDPDLLATVAVDQALRPVGLVPYAGALVSRADRDAVYWSLAEARYPVVAVDEDGEAHTLSRRVAPEPPSPPSAVERFEPLIRTLRAAQGPDAEAAWLERELEQAVRARALVEVTVRLPDGTARSFSLEATGLGGGRLRGRDRAADVERTLPLSSIETVRPL